MSTLARIVEVERLGDLALRLSFDDGLVRDVDLDEMLHGGVVEALRDTVLFAAAHVDEAAGTVAWPNDLDLDPDPDVWPGDHEPATGAGPKVLGERRLEPAG